MGSATANEMGCYKRCSVTNLPSDNLLRADLCLSELDNVSLEAVKLLIALTWMGFWFSRQNPQAHARVPLTYDNELHPWLYEAFKGVGFIWRQEQIKRLWCEGDRAKILFIPCLVDFRWSMGQQITVPDLDQADVDRRMNLERCLSLVDFEK